MQTLTLIIAGVFLPLFPLSMIFNSLFQHVRNAWLRAALLLTWPLPGVWILHTMPSSISKGILVWALFSALLYGFRAVVVREFGVWVGFLATSSWSLGWVAMGATVKPDDVLLQVLASSLPLALLAMLIAELERRYESAYVGVVSGVAQAQPRLATALVLAVLATIGSPLFPAFFSMVSNVARAVSLLPAAAVGLVAVWLLWSWSGARLLQEMLVGPVAVIRQKDISQGTTGIYVLSFILLVIAGLYTAEVML